MNKDIYTETKLSLVLHHTTSHYIPLLYPYNVMCIKEKYSLVKILSKKVPGSDQIQAN